MKCDVGRDQRKEDRKSVYIVWALKTGRRVTRDVEEREHIEMMSSDSPEGLVCDWP